MTTVRLGNTGDQNDVRKFYEGNNYPVIPTHTAVMFLAEDAGELVGIVRLEAEEGGLVLRGMRVAKEKQRQGVGTALLEVLDQYVGADPCWCVCFSHLVRFYGQIGFREIPVESAPLHLQERTRAYRTLGHQITMMKRPSPKDVVEV